MEVSCVIIELKPDSYARVEEWKNFIFSNKKEATSTLRNEGVTVETFFLARIEDRDYLVGYMRAKSMDHAHEIVKHSISNVDAYHQKFKMDTWVKGIESELIFDLTRIHNEENIE
jgi:hypothetical protein